MIRLRLGLILALATACATNRAASEPPIQSRFAPATDGAAWASVSPKAPQLPAWARILAESLPATTAAQINLDCLHRTKNPLGPVLSAQIRWVVADANRCDYAKQYAAADLVKAGRIEEDAAGLVRADSVPEPDRSALAFARELTLAAASVTDEEVAALIEKFGPDDVVAIVHTVAYANFQDRLLLAMGLTSEPGGAVAARFVAIPAEGEVAVPERPALADGTAPAAGVADVGRAWSERSTAELHDLLESQKARTPRIPMPDAGRIARYPRDVRSRPRKVNWGAISVGYQPEMTKAWFQTMESFDREAKLDDVFVNSVFWVVTRTSDCFY